MTFVDIDPLTLYLMLAAAAIGALVGSGIVCKWDLKTVRYALSVGLVILAVALVCKNASVGPFGAVGTATGLSGIKLVVGVVINFFLGALMMIGVVIAYKVACFLSLSTLTYIVCVVMIITSATFFRDARKMSMPSVSERTQKELQKSGAMTD